MLAELADRLAERLPGPDVTREQLRAGIWWSGPQALVVDDHDMVSASGPDPVSALVELLPVARDVGLHGEPMRPLSPGRALHATRAGAPRLVQVAVREDGLEEPGCEG